IRYGVVSNLTMSGEALERRIRRLIPHAVPELVVTSSDIGVRKPNPMIFGYVLSRCGASAEHTWFCGDNPQADVEGSSAVGMYPVWYDSDIECPYRDKERESTPSCDMLRIREWSEMTGLLELL
ncbi:MAG: HAD family hydrolase, partial [Christensenellales bacterium]